VASTDAGVGGGVPPVPPPVLPLLPLPPPPHAVRNTDKKRRIDGQHENKRRVITSPLLTYAVGCARRSMIWENRQAESLLWSSVEWSSISGILVGDDVAITIDAEFIKT
jgi:hypothetical protein